MSCFPLIDPSEGGCTLVHSELEVKSDLDFKLPSFTPCDPVTKSTLNRTTTIAMNSPDPGSPISTDTSGSPPPDDFQFSNRDQQQVPNVGDARSSSNASYSFTSTSGPSKRRLPGGASSEGPQRRDPKSRRREDTFGPASGSRRVVIEGQGPHTIGRGAGLGGNFQSRGDYSSRRDKEELIDLPLVEQLRQGQLP